MVKRRAGDSGYAIKGNNYNTILTAGGTVRYRPVNGLEIGFGGQYRYEPGVNGNQAAPYATPDVDYEDYVRGEVVQNYMLENPFESIDFPDPNLRFATSGKLIGYLGFGGFGPITWNNFYVSYESLHPKGQTSESFQGQSYNIYTTDLTDERTSLIIGNELQLKIIPNRLDVAWAMLYGNSEDRDNDIIVSEEDRIFYSTVL